MEGCMFMAIYACVVREKHNASGLDMRISTGKALMQVLRSPSAWFFLFPAVYSVFCKVLSTRVRQSREAALNASSICCTGSAVKRNKLPVGFALGEGVGSIRFEEDKKKTWKKRLVDAGEWIAARRGSCSLYHVLIIRGIFFSELAHAVGVILYA